MYGQNGSHAPLSKAITVMPNINAVNTRFIHCLLYRGPFRLHSPSHYRHEDAGRHYRHAPCLCPSQLCPPEFIAISSLNARPAGLLGQAIANPPSSCDARNVRAAPHTWHTAGNHSRPSGVAIRQR